jgi:hypothetical protein
MRFAYAAAVLISLSGCVAHDGQQASDSEQQLLQAAGLDSPVERPLWLQLKWSRAAAHEQRD